VVVGTPIGAGQVLTMSGTGDDIRQVTHGRKASSASVAWSPDGRRLVYDLGRAGHPEHGQPLVVSHANGSHAHTITPPHGLAVAPAWSPDGRLIAYVKPYAPGEFADRTGTIEVIPAQGGASRGVSTVYDGHEPSWAADSRTLYYASSWEGGQGFVSVAVHHGATPYLAFVCTAVLRCDTVGSPSFAPGGGVVGFLVTVDHPARALVAVTRFGSTTGSDPLMRLPLYTCCMTWTPPRPGQTAV
jgi:dipeptidyl aminopeptidase/acylaminoacyl peptidase